MKRVAILLAGGSGKRFWPLSKKGRPKQLISLFSQKTLIEETVFRINKLIEKNLIYIATNRELGEKLKRMKIVPEKNILEEPLSKNTAPTIVWAIKKLNQLHKDVVVGIFPSDHHIKNEEQFLETLDFAYNVAESEKKLVTFGIKPSSPDTGYGYIEVDEKSFKNGFYSVKAFKEKPDLETAKKYVSMGNFFWNSGMFLWRADTFFENLKKYSPDFYDFYNKLSSDEEKAFIEVSELSIDYALMEKSKEIILVPGEFGWSDVGSWESVYKLFPKDKEGNVKKGDAYFLDSKNNLVFSNNLKIALLGVEDLFIVEDEGKILIGRMGKGQKVRDIFDIIEKK